MKLSDFKAKSLAKKLKYIDGEPNIIEYDKLDGDIDFYTLDEITLNKIGSELLTNISPNERDEIFMYKLIPYLCNVEVDITIDEFEAMLKSTNKNFLKFMEVIISMINDTLTMVTTIESIETTTKNITEKANIVVETDEDKLNRLYDEVDKASNRNEKRRLMREITALEEKMKLNE